MVNPDPRRRPTAVEAYTQYQKIRSNISGVTRIWRARPRHENLFCQIVFDALVLVSPFSKPISCVLSEMEVVQSSSQDSILMLSIIMLSLLLSHTNLSYVLIPCPVQTC